MTPDPYREQISAHQPQLPLDFAARISLQLLVLCASSITDIALAWAHLTPYRRMNNAFNAPLMRHFLICIFQCMRQASCLRRAPVPSARITASPLLCGRARPRAQPLFPAAVLRGTIPARARALERASPPLLRSIQTGRSRTEERERISYINHGVQRQRSRLSARRAFPSPRNHDRCPLTTVTRANERDPSRPTVLRVRPLRQAARRSRDRQSPVGH